MNKELDGFAEIEAMKIVAAAIEPLDHESRERVMNWVAAKFKLLAGRQTSPPASSRNSGAKSADAD